MESILNPYNQISYPGYPFVQTHPDRLATLAHLYGMTPAPVEHCRVLELGCGDGGNLIPMAWQLSGSEFWGIDLASSAIENGRRQIAELELSNIRLEVLDLMGFPLASGPFDYVLAHGLFSWVPPAAQEKIMEIIGNCLAPEGVAYISYNTLPGGHLRLMLREMMQYHIRTMESPEEQISGGKALIRFLADATAHSSIQNDYSEVLREEWEKRMSICSSASLYHDELGEHNHHFYFHEFMAHAKPHGLQFLAEADFPAMQVGNFMPEVGELLKELEDDIVTREQYLDFLKGRRFRQTLLCRETILLERNIPGERVASLLVASKAHPSGPLGELSGNTPVEFCGPHNSSINTAHPLIKSALLCLAEHWPLPLSFKTLRELAQQRLGASSATTCFDSPEDRTAMLTTFFLCYGAGLLNFHAWAPRLTLKAGPRPLASPLARLQIRQGSHVTTLCHERVEIDGALAKIFIQLLDGTRDRPMILKALEEAVLTGKAAMLDNDKPVSNVDRLRFLLAEGLEVRLEHLARMGLLLS